MASRESLLIAPAAIPVRIRAETSPFLKPLRIPEKSILSLSCVRAIVIAPVFSSYVGLCVVFLRCSLYIVVLLSVAASEYHTCKGEQECAQADKKTEP